MVRPSHPCAPPLRGEHQHPTPSRRAERAACRRYAIMVTPTQSVPEVLAVWGSDYKKAIVCRRYTIMVAQSPPQIPHITIPITIPTTHHHHTSSSSTTLPLSRTSGTLLVPLATSPPLDPLQRPTKKMSNKPKGLIAHFLSPLRCGRDSNSRPHA